MYSNSHGLRSEHLREDAYCAQVDQQLLAALRETLELQREVEPSLRAIASKTVQSNSKRSWHPPANQLSFVETDFFEPDIVRDT